MNIEAIPRTPSVPLFFIVLIAHLPILGHNLHAQDFKMQYLIKLISKAMYLQ